MSDRHPTESSNGIVMATLAIPSDAIRVIAAPPDTISQKNVEAATGVPVGKKCRPSSRGASMSYSRPCRGYDGRRSRASAPAPLPGRCRRIAAPPATTPVDQRGDAKRDRVALFARRQPGQRGDQVRAHKAKLGL